MGRPRKKPGFDAGVIDKNKISEISKAYTEFLRDNQQSFTDSVSYKAIELFSLSYNISPMKMRKILITAGVYKTDISCRIAQVKKEGRLLMIFV